MRLLKSITAIMFVTVMALLYVHQQVELVKLSYSIQNKEKGLKQMADYRARLKYDIDNLETPSRLEQMLLAKNSDYAFPKKSQVFKDVVPANASRHNDALGGIAVERRTGLGIFEFLTPRAEAQARER